ncbi:MAG TPA: uracil-DNA glycosylase [Nitrospiria bacterium]|nr:uracil-DNA glycosylase [Nitrospiria bacterium]
MALQYFYPGAGMMNRPDTLAVMFLELVRDIKEEFAYQSAMGMTETESDPPMLPRINFTTTLTSIREEIGDCRRCKLHLKRKNIVFGTGNVEARLVFVGEGPGEDEDIEGLPFVGRAGQLLTKIIEAMGMKRSDVYIANIVKCRPPNNRNPEPDEIESCLPFLKSQLEAINPLLIVALGTFAAQTLLGSRERISQMRGRFHSYNGIKVMPTFHPSYLLRNPDEKRVVWEDMKMVMEELKKMGQK